MRSDDDDDDDKGNHLKDEIVALEGSKRPTMLRPPAWCHNNPGSPKEAEKIQMPE